MHSRYTLMFLMVLPALHGMAQCTFTPTITPNAPILCPNDSALLTTQAYDAYQWYKDGSPVTGATGQTLVVHQFADAGSSFTVSATLDGCTEMSASVLVDGWVFLLPYVIHGGDEPINQGPDLQFCEGDTLTLTLAPGFTENIVWTNDGNPIPGENSPVLTVTANGNYSVSAAPGECPNSIMGIGVEISASFQVNMQPDIVDLGDGELCAYPAGNSTQWYLAGVPIDTSLCITTTSSGPYTVFVDYGQPCQGLSDPWSSTGIHQEAIKKPMVSPLPASTTMTVDWPAGISTGGTWMLLDAAGRTVHAGNIPATGSNSINVADLAPGNYVLAAPGCGVRPVQVTLVH